MQPILKIRFDSLAGYSRSPMMAMIAEELAWFEEGNEKILGLLVFDLVDLDYACYILGRDKKLRFRSVWIDCSIPTTDDAHTRLESKMAEYVHLPPEHFHQGDEVGLPLDFFSPAVAPKQRNLVFSTLISERRYSPARGLLNEMMHYFEDTDGNFVQQFQSAGFDARIWELYLYALFTELGYAFNHGYAAPDFYCQGLLGEFLLEATTVNPSDKPPEINDTNREAYFQHYIPRKFGSALFSKLQKEYWKLPHVSGMPLLIAVQDFHARGSMSWSNTALIEYLYGIRQVERKNPCGGSEISSEQVEFYEWEGKRISAGFFTLPGAEHISAVLANPDGTINKFNRLGFLAGFGDSDIRMIRSGIRYRNKSLTPETFVQEVYSPDYVERWVEGLSVFHNPNAEHPLPEVMLPNAAHHTSRDGKILTDMPSLHPVGTNTVIVAPT